MSSYIRKLIQIAKSQGWTVTNTKNSHIKFLPADKTKRIVITGSTPSENRAMKNLIKDLERSGLKL